MLIKLLSQGEQPVTGLTQSGLVCFVEMPLHGVHPGEDDVTHRTRHPGALVDHGVVLEPLCRLVDLATSGLRTPELHLVAVHLSHVTVETWLVGEPLATHPALVGPVG